MHLSRCNGIEPIPPHFSTTAVLHTLHPALSLAWLTLKRSPLHKHRAAFFPGWQPLSDSILNFHLFALMMKSTKGREKRKSYHSEKKLGAATAPRKTELTVTNVRKLRGWFQQQRSLNLYIQILVHLSFNTVYTNVISNVPKRAFQDPWFKSTPPSCAIVPNMPSHSNCT